MVERCSRIALILLLTSVPVLAGCAKWTGTSDASSPGSPGSTDGDRAGRGSMGGAPAAGRAPGSPDRPNPKEFVEVGELRDIHFDFDRYDIRPQDAQVLEANAVLLKSNPKWQVLIEGHADQRGTTEYNLALGDRRARASLNYLVAQGVRSNRISIISYGKERPLCRESNEDCWGQNRRAHFLVKAR
jgi:peptidoglycan-associated lipoprotein